MIYIAQSDLSFVLSFGPVTTRVLQLSNSTAFETIRILLTISSSKSLCKLYDDDKMESCQFLVVYRDDQVPKPNIRNNFVFFDDNNVHNKNKLGHV